MTLTPGMLISGRYQVLRVIASGAMSEVYEATDTRHGTRVALKVLRISLQGLEEAVQRFRREAEMARRIASEHVVKVLEVDDNDQQGPILVLEYLEGETLEERLHREHSISLDKAFPIVDQIFEGLQAAHEAGVIHRDLKPGNVFLSHSGTTQAGDVPLVKLIDFGTGKARRTSDPDREALTKAGQNVGTFAYMAPEQSVAPSKVDCRADLYACGVVIFRMLSGRLPFESKNIIDMLRRKQAAPAMRLAEVMGGQGAGIPQGVDRFVASLLERNPELRPADAKTAREQWRHLALSFRSGEG